MTDVDPARKLSFKCPRCVSNIEFDASAMMSGLPITCRKCGFQVQLPQGGGSDIDTALAKIQTLAKKDGG